MKNRLIVKLSNMIGMISIILLVYWVFIFISIAVFGLKIFKENITESFYLSVMGILSLMFGSLIINIMFNLTRIAEKHNNDSLIEPKKSFKKYWLIITLSFPIIVGLLFGGDYLTTKKKESNLIASAKSIIDNNFDSMDHLLNYNFDEKWIIKTDEVLSLYSKTDKDLPYIELIVSDSIGKSIVFLGFKDYSINYYDTIQPKKVYFIRQTTSEEREYLANVYFKNLNEVRFNAHDGKYELFYPYFKNGKKIVIYFSDYQRYGKIGS